MARPTKNPQGSYSDFARALRTLRLQAGLSVRTLSAVTGVPASTIYAAESGQRLPSPENLTALAPALNISDGALIGRRNEAVHAAHPAPSTQPSGPEPRLVTTAQDLAGALEALRKRAGSPSLRGLAEQTASSPASLSRALNGQLPASRETFVSLVQALDPTDEELAGFTAAFDRLAFGRISRPSQQTLTLLYGTATSCAHPDCPVPLVVWRDGKPTHAVEVAFIEPVASSKDTSFDNLILLCPTHHRAQHDVPTEQLRRWKEDQAHQSQVAAELRSTYPDALDDYAIPVLRPAEHQTITVAEPPPETEQLERAELTDHMAPEKHR